MGLLDIIEGYVEPAWDFVMGTEEWESGDLVGFSGGLRGFLDPAADFFASDSRMFDVAGNLLSSGAKAYLKSQKEGGPFKQTEVKAPKITRAASTVNVAGLASLKNPVGVNNPDVRAAMQRLAQRTNFNPDMQRISQQYMTKRQGARTMDVGSPSLPRVRTATPASVRTQSKQEVVIDG